MVGDTVRPIYNLNFFRCHPIFRIPRTIVPTRLGRNFHGKAEAGIVGHFGTFGGEIRSLTLRTVTKLAMSLPNCDSFCWARRFVCVIRAFEAAAVSHDRIHTIDDAPGDVVSRIIQACDIMLQPYPMESLHAGVRDGSDRKRRRGSLESRFTQ